MEWIIVTVIVILAALIACILWAMQLSKRSFQCKSCSKEFKVKWNKLLFAIHSDEYYEIKCPFCGNKGCIEKDAKES
ncbi:hypothetical protein [Ruminococcus flavefaciens]|uniref:hypothetical protein n=1 Tax=Ruminococcus flavefaciens TaxID=1265 RepID=UPI0013DC9A84|nr:hypothetical protein [Ruminococcus flavefaciens]MBR3419363.1 hypothetical protein [Oscillospiraceae bacterium]